MDRIEQLMKDAQPRVENRAQRREAIRPVRSHFPRIRTLCVWPRALRRDAMPCGPRPRRYWPLLQSWPQSLSVPI